MDGEYRKVEPIHEVYIRYDKLHLTGHQFLITVLTDIFKIVRGSNMPLPQMSRHMKTSFKVVVELCDN